MAITAGHSFLVHASKNEETRPTIVGAKLPTTGKLFDMLSGLYYGAPRECDIGIAFRPLDDGTQDNPCRTLLLAYLDGQRIEAGRKVAARLQAVTTHRSGLGLLFIIAGVEHGQHHLIVARFPADQGVIAEERRQTLDLQFIERVFMKNAQAYKCVLYRCRSVQAGFWDGQAVDRQINEGREISDYWISDFLHSELTTTSAAGTKRFAIALREAIRSTQDSVIHDELWTAAKLARGQAGRTGSIARIAHNLGLTAAATAAIRAALPRSELFDESFKFDQAEYDAHITFRSVVLDNGAVLTADNARFEDIFRQEAVGQTGSRQRFSTEGTIVEQRLRKTS
jgi:hypothetical protein